MYVVEEELTSKISQTKSDHFFCDTVTFFSIVSKEGYDKEEKLR